MGNPEFQDYKNLKAASTFGGRLESQTSDMLELHFDLHPK